jgi:hypothetical protein
MAQSIVNKAANVALLGLAFSDAIVNALAGNWGQIVYDYSAGYAGNPQTGAPARQDPAAAARAYGPAVAAVLLAELKKYAMRKFPVRG